MGKFNLAEVANSMKTSVSKHTPEILMGVGIAGMLSATVLAVKGTIKAVHIIEQRTKEEKEKDENFKKFGWKGVVKETWKCYIPTVSIATISTVCLIGSSTASLKRSAALATAYKIAETAHKEYRDKVIETIGEKKEEVVKDKVAQERLDKNPISVNDVILTGKGDTLCYDYMTGRYFKGDIDVIKKAIHKLNDRMYSNMYVSLNEFYIEIGLEQVEIGYDLGWTIDNGFIKLDLRSRLTDKDEPCAVISFELAPKHDYSKLY